MSRLLRLLTIGHSYVVALNRRLPHEMARQGADRWQVTVAAPRFVQADLRPIYLENFPKEAAELVPIEAYLTFRPHLLLYGRRLKSLMAQRWDLIHCWEEPYVLSAWQCAWWAQRQPLVYYTFQNIAKNYPPPFQQIERFVMRRANAWLGAGHTVVATLQARKGYRERPHRVITLGVDAETFRPDRLAGRAIRQKLGWEADGPPVIGYLGRFVPEKGLGLLQRVLEKLRSPWRALFVGGGPLKMDLQQWAQSYGAERVQIVDSVVHEEVPNYLNAMDILAGPSQTTPKWREQLGRMLIEAMACGVPVIGSDSGEIPYVIGDAGCVVPEKDVAAWSATLEYLLNSPERRRQLGQAGRQRIEAQFAWSVIARQHLDFFNQLLDT
jgi:glycosyltransferase involved in cell wall biosynthesis